MDYTAKEMTDPFPCPGKCGGTIFFTEDAAMHQPHPACAWFMDPGHDALFIARTVRESLGLPDPNV
jgi:hypothetical protein